MAGSGGTNLRDANFTSGGRQVQIRNGKLTISGADYGSLANGDRVKVHSDGRVTVNEAERKPVEK